MKVIYKSARFAIVLEQSSKTGKFAITYGKSVKIGLSRELAAKELGECIFHALEADGELLEE